MHKERQELKKKKKTQPKTVVSKPEKQIVRTARLRVFSKVQFIHINSL